MKVEWRLTSAEMRLLPEGYTPIGEGLPDISIIKFCEKNSPVPRTFLWNKAFIDIMMRYSAFRHVADGNIEADDVMHLVTSLEKITSKMEKDEDKEEELFQAIASGELTPAEAARERVIDAMEQIVTGMKIDSFNLYMNEKRTQWKAAYFSNPDYVKYPALVAIRPRTAIEVELERQLKMALIAEDMSKADHPLWKHVHEAYLAFDDVTSGVIQAYNSLMHFSEMPPDDPLPYSLHRITIDQLIAFQKVIEDPTKKDSHQHVIQALMYSALYLELPIDYNEKTIGSIRREVIMQFRSIITDYQTLLSDTRIKVSPQQAQQESAILCTGSDNEKQDVLTKHFLICQCLGKPLEDCATALSATLDALYANQGATTTSTTFPVTLSAAPVNVSATPPTSSTTKDTPKDFMDDTLSNASRRTSKSTGKERDLSVSTTSPDDFWSSWGGPIIGVAALGLFALLFVKANQSSL